MANVIPMKGMREAPKSVRSEMQTLILTAAEMRQWVLPPFQRELRVNEKVRALSEVLKAGGGMMTGIMTVGRVSGNRTLFLVDGQHRREAFYLSELSECIADVRMCEFDSLAEMAEEFVALNSRLVNMRPDDILRGMEASLRSLQYIRKSCDFVGYEHIRRSSSKSAVLSMSAVIRCWVGSAGETPSANGAGRSALQLAEDLEDASAQELVKFLLTARSAWGSDPEYYRLWGNLNLTISMWMWRRLVLERDNRIKRSVQLNADQFRRCLMSVSASPDYIDWLTGRVLSEKDRSPCYTRLKAIFAARLRSDSKDPTVKPLLPSPAWASK